MAAIYQYHLIPPAAKLFYLRRYMAEWIDKWPVAITSFDQWLLKNRPCVIPGHPEHMKYQATHCYYCDVRLTYGNEDTGRSVDHFWPQSLGKSGDTRMVICCRKCNILKGAYTPKKFGSITVDAFLGRKNVFGFGVKKSKLFLERVNIIRNDMLYNMGPKVYIIKK